MAWGAVIAAGISYLGAREGQAAGKKAEKQERLITAERVKRLERDQETERSTLNVLLHGGGFSGESVSNQIYRQEFMKLQQEEVEWLKMVGQSRYDAAGAETKAMQYSGFSKLGVIAGEGLDYFLGS